jgi:hypothetical protein
MPTHPTNGIWAVATNDNKSSNGIWAHHTIHTVVVQQCCNALYRVITICMGTRQIIYSTPRQPAGEMRSRHGANHQYRELNQVTSKLSTVTTDSIVSGSLRTSLSSSKGSASAFTSKINENDAAVSPFKSTSSSEIAKSSSLRSSSYVYLLSMTEADILSPLLLLSSMAYSLSLYAVST